VVSTVATPDEWQCKIRTGGVRRLAVANGPNIFQMLLVYFLSITVLRSCVPLIIFCCGSFTPDAALHGAALCRNAAHRIGYKHVRNKSGSGNLENDTTH